MTRNGHMATAAGLIAVLLCFSVCLSARLAEAGTNVQGKTDPIVPEVKQPRLVVFLVHGFNADAKNSGLEKLIEGDLPAIPEDAYVLRFSWNDKKGVQPAVQPLKEAVRSYRVRYPDAKVVLIGHSAGGLVCREAAASNPDVSMVIFLATPHGGLDAARWIQTTVFDRHDPLLAQALSFWGSEQDIETWPKMKMDVFHLPPWLRHLFHHAVPVVLREPPPWSALRSAATLSRGSAATVTVPCLNVYARRPEGFKPGWQTRFVYCTKPVFVSQNIDGRRFDIRMSPPIKPSNRVHHFTAIEVLDDGFETGDGLVSKTSAEALSGVNVKQFPVEMFGEYNHDAIVTDPSTLKEIRAFLSPQNREFEHLVEGPLHHLGDNSFEGDINSGFRTRAEGIQWSTSFFLPPSVAARADGFVVINIRGAQYSTLYLNGVVTGKLTNTTQDNGQAQAYPIPAGALRPGVNTVMIISHIAPQSHENNDDIEFHDVTIFFGDINRHVR